MQTDAKPTVEQIWHRVACQNSMPVTTPKPPAPVAGDTREQYGLSILRFIMADEYPYSCTDEQLSLALHVAPIAAAAVPGDYRSHVADAVAKAKRLILEVQRFRAADAAKLAEQLATLAAVEPVPPSGGAKVPRVPFTPILPPAPAAARRF